MRLPARPDAADAWPRDGLEPVSACPVCAGSSRSLLYRDLRDRYYFCAPGAWQLYRCTTCGSAYLDPRPSRATIARAYTHYYTHTPTAASKPRQNLRTALWYGLVNDRYRTVYRPALPGLYSWVRWQPGRLALFDYWLRGLTLPYPGARLLDVGCGSGAYLQTLRGSGWEGYGLEVDAQAVAAARAANLRVVQGTIEAAPFAPQSFAAITLSHVIEHVHDPIHALRACATMLQPDGVIWLATPNLGGLGHQRYRFDWVGLDAPRHLVLFTLHALLLMAAQVGLYPVSIIPAMHRIDWYFATSLAIQRGIDPTITPLPHDAVTRRAARQAIQRARVRPDQADELVMLLRKHDQAG